MANMENIQEAETNTDHTYRIPSAIYLKKLLKEQMRPSADRTKKEVFSLIQALQIIMFFINPNMPQSERVQHVENALDRFKDEDDQPVLMLNNKQIDDVIDNLLAIH